MKQTMLKNTSFKFTFAWIHNKYLENKSVFHYYGCYYKYYSIGDYSDSVSYCQDIDITNISRCHPANTPEDSGIF